MCLIIDNPAGLKIDTSLLIEGLDNNPDGWGIMTCQSGRIRIQRGMDAKSFLDIADCYAGIPHSIHFRWSTHGTKGISNCHPFSILNNKYAIMHNGVLDIPLEHGTRDRSDTYHFCRYVLAPMLKHNPQLFGSDYLEKLLSDMIGSSNKLVILRADGESMIVNRDSGIEHEGMWLSNGHSLPSPKRSFGSFRWESSGWNKHAEDDETEVKQLESVQIVKDKDDCKYNLDSLTDLSGLSYSQVLDVVWESPETIADLISTYFDYEMR